ncbi:protease inhibitor Inh/omp19 family protein [Aquabacter sediminis]|uniref:protease inhibitor Inh/omp19 family protein n=1 Tax=Aquabacter sediminis TaxID=3029197 RepID=UPI00237E1AD1|nr:protease inhibitor Inh/omp19 family protein [Aquabacter sp. P-9]MDE1569520.1 protease inhibitor Inh/omp19 family protein [Aquabacter sp. P-9]
MMRLPTAPLLLALCAASLGAGLDASISPTFAQGAGTPKSEPRPATQKPAPPRPAKVDPALQAAAQKIAGPFILSSADGARTCPLTLRADPASNAASGSGAAFLVSQEGGPCTAIAFAPQMVAWSLDPSGAIRLLDAQGRLGVEFTEATGGSYEALREGDGVYFLAHPAAQSGIEVSVEEMTGDWDLARTAGKPICRWTLSPDPGPGGSLMVRVAPGCDAGLSQFVPSGWRIEGGNVLVESGSGAPPVRFARQEDGSWAKVPERGRPLLLLRP